MKALKVLFFVMAFGLTATVGYSQVGLRVGVNLANQKSEILGEKVETDGIIGLNAALVYNAQISSMFSIQPELHYIQKGSALNDVPILGDLKSVINYAELAVALKVKLVNIGENGGVYVAATPYAGYALSAKSYVGDESEKYEFSDDDNRMDYGVGIGAGVQFGGLFLDARYNLGLANLSKIEETSTKNVGILIAVGYMFSF